MDLLGSILNSMDKPPVVSNAATKQLQSKFNIFLVKFIKNFLLCFLYVAFQILLSLVV